MPPDPARVAAVGRLLEAQPVEPIQPANHTRNFLISAAAYVVIGGWRAEPRTLAMLAGVILFHELGHFVAMRAYGYKDARILFLPMFGGVTLGQETRPNSYQRCVVALAGPIPGILLGGALGVALLFAFHPLLFELASTLLLLNLLNLAPVASLDGGRFLDETLAPWPKAAALARAATGLIGAALAFAVLEAPILGLWLAMAAAGALAVGFPRAAVVAALRERVGPADALSDWPGEHLEWLVDRIDRATPSGKPSVEAVARDARSIWSSLRGSPLTRAQLAWLGLCYAGTLAFGLGVAVGWWKLLAPFTGETA